MQLQEEEKTDLQVSSKRRIFLFFLPFEVVIVGFNFRQSFFDFFSDQSSIKRTMGQSVLE
jgi:hypothetical protein